MTSAEQKIPQQQQQSEEKIQNTSNKSDWKEGEKEETKQEVVDPRIVKNSKILLKLFSVTNIPQPTVTRTSEGKINLIWNEKSIFLLVNEDMVECNIVHGIHATEHLEYKMKNFENLVEKIANFFPSLK